MRIHSKNLRKNQSGLVPIIVTVIIVVILSLIVIAFSQLMRREERQALDQQLSSQAYYAAESAINDAAAALSRGDITEDYNDCVQTDGAKPLSKPVLSTELGVQYSCVTLTSNPQSLEYDIVQTDTSLQAELHATDSAGVNLLHFDTINTTWQNTSGVTSFASAADRSLPPVTGWPVNQAGLIRFEIFRLVSETNPSAPKYSRDALVQNRRVYWFYPNDTTTNPSADWTATESGSVVGGNCSGSTCSANVSGLPQGSYVIRVKSLYRPSKMSITGTLAGGAGAAHFKGAQIVIDATGKANDVLRRISARVAVNEAYAIPEYLLQSYNGICRTLEVAPFNYNNLGDCPGTPQAD